MKRAVFSPLLVAAALAPSLGACLESPQEVIEYDATAKSTGVRARSFGEWNVELTRADVALGPFYFCAAASGSSTLCEASIAELRTVTVVDALRATPTRLGRVHGFTGSIKSAAYDLGVSWFDTQSAATPMTGALGGHSVHLEGVLTKGSTRIPFAGDVDVVPQYQGQNAIPTAPVDANVTSDRTRLEVELDPVAWLGQLDFEAIAASGSSPFAIAPGSPAQSAVILGLKNLAPPRLSWVGTTP